MKKTISAALFALFLLLAATPLWGAPPVSAEERLRLASEVVEEMCSMPEGGIPKDLIREARAIAVFPSVYKGGFMIGGAYGKGVLFAKDSKGAWHGPVFLSIKSGSLGWQIGVQATDLVLVVMNDRGLGALFKNNVALGGEATLAAGPVGRKVKAATDATLKAEIYSYSRSKGFFAGISLEGAYISHDYRLDEAYWAAPLTPREILKAKTPKSGAGARLVKLLSELSRP